jgi:hypothetical protein
MSGSVMCATEGVAAGGGRRDARRSARQDLGRRRKKVWGSGVFLKVRVPQAQEGLGFRGVARKSMCRRRKKAWVRGCF